MTFLHLPIHANCRMQHSIFAYVIHMYIQFIDNIYQKLSAAKQLPVLYFLQQISTPIFFYEKFEKKNFQ